MINYMYKSVLTRWISGITRMFLAAVLLISPGIIMSCGDREVEEMPDPILNDAYSLYILKPGPFEVIGPEYPSQKEFLVLRADDVELSCGSFPGAHIPVGAVEQELASFARETIQNTNWLPGCTRWQLDAAGVNIGERWYYSVTLLVRRDPEWSAQLTQIARSVHRSELERFVDNTDMIVRQYYTLNERDICIFTLSGSPEDVVVKERAVRRLLSSVRFSAMEAMAATGTD